MMRFTPVAIALSLVVSGCVSVHPSSERQPRERERHETSRTRNYTLWLGEARFIRSAPLFVELRLVEVNDSRCPIGVPCIRQGEARATIQVRMGSYGKKVWQETFTLTDRPGSRHGRTRIVGDYEFTLLDVQPYPAAGRTMGHHAPPPYAVVAAKELRIGLSGSSNPGR